MHYSGPMWSPLLSLIASDHFWSFVGITLWLAIAILRERERCNHPNKYQTHSSYYHLFVQHRWVCELIAGLRSIDRSPVPTRFVHRLLEGWIGVKLAQEILKCKLGFIGLHKSTEGLILVRYIWFWCAILLIYCNKNPKKYWFNLKISLI